MEQTLLFSATDNSIDIVSAVLFAIAIFHSVKYLWRNHIPTEAKIIYLFVIVISSLHIFQTTYQSLTGHASFFRVWDFSNYLTGFLFLMVVHVVANVFYKLKKGT